MIENVIIINDQAYISGGLAKIAINSAVELKRKGMNVIFFYALGPIDEQLIKAGVKCVCIGGEHIGKTKNIIYLLKGIWNNQAKQKLEKLLQELDNKKTVIHIHGWTKAISSSVFRACKKFNYKTFITLHDYFLICQNGGLYNYKKNKKCSNNPGSIKCYLCNCDKKNYLYKIYRNVRQIVTKIGYLKLNPEIIYISEFSKNILKKNGFFSKNENILYNHVELSNLSRIEVENNDIYAFIGRVSADKGIDIFCKAIEQTKSKGIVIGDGPLLEKYKKEYPQIEFIGWVQFNDMYKYLQKVRCLIVTSKWYETMGLTVVEMQSNGIPCIVPSQFAGSMYIENGLTGLYYDINNIDTLSKAIEQTKNNEFLEKMSTNFQNKLDRKKFSLEEHVLKLIEIYNK